VNTIKIGSIIIYLHDWADIFVSLAKFWLDTHFGDTIIIIHLVSVFISWLYTRVICFPILLYYGWYLAFNDFLADFAANEETKHLGSLVQHVQTTGGVALCLVCFLNFFWFYLIVAIMFKSTKSGVESSGYERAAGCHEDEQKKV
jgi:hypothetical protein